MEICNWCGKDIEYGYLADDYYVMCEECRHNIYSDNEFRKKYHDGEIFWTTFYDDDIE